ncbi:hypothetical protein B0H13DRAFT_139587 [Mycena leptocephala]|nr:hypothetical protein B0H13DRAFT_139587 [Mycena leptocephala]
MSRKHADPSRSINVSSPVLILQLNQLFASLNLPFTVESHSQLTPSLLIGILESLLSDRLPILEQHREALFSSNAYAGKVHCMKIFLGVLQSDILKQDVGLNNVDPRLLARTADKETIFVARLLCWYGRRRGLISRSASGSDARRTGSEVPRSYSAEIPEVEARNESGSPSTLTTRRTETSPIYTGLGHPESDTSLSSPSSSAPQDVVVGPRCIHEVPSPSLVLSPGSYMGDIDSSLFARELHPGDDVESRLLAPADNTTVRYDGYISLVPEEVEIAAFEARRAEERRRREKGKAKEKAKRTRPLLPPGPPPRTRQAPDGDEATPPADAHALAAAQERRMELLRRKAEMLEELARLRVSEYEQLHGSDT